VLAWQLLNIKLFGWKIWSQLKNWKKRRQRHYVAQIQLHTSKIKSLFGIICQFHLCSPWCTCVGGKTCMCYFFWSTWSGFINYYYIFQLTCLKPHGANEGLDFQNRKARCNYIFPNHSCWLKWHWIL